MATQRMRHFEGQSAVVTGAASGIGYALCRELDRRGAVVYAVDRNFDGLQRLQEASSERLSAVELDVTDELGVQLLLNRVVSERGALDYLFNNAGIVVGGDFLEMTTEAWQRIIDVNLWGVIYGTRHAYSLMRRQGHGSIINTASTAGLVPVAKSTAYAATKHAVVGLSVSLREEARHHGINVSVVIPGLVDTGIFESATNLAGHDYAAEIERVPLLKISPEKAAKAILKGVLKRRAEIVFPAYNRIIVFLYRVMPRVMGRLINL